MRRLLIQFVSVWRRFQAAWTEPVKKPVKKCPHREPINKLPQEIMFLLACPLKPLTETDMGRQTTICDNVGSRYALRNQT
jgi:hypothetical protein